MQKPTAVITGGAQGIGRVTAGVLARDGYAVALLDLRPDGAAAAAAELRASGATTLGLEADVSNELAVTTAFDRVMAEFGRLDLLVNGAAWVDPPFEVVDMPLQVWERTFSVALTGTFLCSRQALRVMLPAGSGSIVNISSVAGKMPYRFRAAYAAAKAGVQSLTRTLALEAGPHGIRVNAVCPGPVEGPRIETVFEQRAGAANIPYAAVREEFERGAALRQLTRPEDVAELIRFLASPAAARITGQLIDVDAGYLLK